MASKKSSGKKSGGKKSGSKKTSSFAAAVSTGNAEAILMSVSTAATAADAKESAILQCLISCFFNNGLPPLSPSSPIVWTTIPDNIITIIGNCVRDCILGKGFQSPGWAGPFQNLKNQNQVSIVSNLVSGMAAVITP